MSATIRAVVMEHRIPAGALGTEPVTLDARACLVTHATGVILVDTGMDASGHALDAALGEAGATWSDVSHVLITHVHRDHIGACPADRAARRLSDLDPVKLGVDYLQGRPERHRLFRVKRADSR